jgi:hypothetical protein
MVKIVPANENLQQQDGVKISIQAVREDGTPAGQEIQLSKYPIVVGRVDYDDRIKGISEYQPAIRAKDGKRIEPIDYIVARHQEGVEVIDGIYGRWRVSGENDATHREYITINQEGGRATITYAKKNCLPVRIRDGRGEYILPPDRKLVLEEGEEVELHLSGTYTKVEEAPSGNWIMEPAWLRIKVLSKKLYSKNL